MINIVTPIFFFDILIFIGVFVLFMPPLFFTLIQEFLKKNIYLLNYWSNLGLSIILAFIMAYLIPSAWWIFLFYLILFNLSRIFIWSRFNIFWEKNKLYDRPIRVDAFLLSIYICFSISVLWEIPVQLTSFQNIDAVILSLFKALAIPLFFIKVRKLGFKINNYWIGALTGAILHIILSLIYFNIIGYNIETIAFVNMGRFFWIPLFYVSIPKIVKYY